MRYSRRCSESCPGFLRRPAVVHGPRSGSPEKQTAGGLIVSLSLRDLATTSTTVHMLADRVLLYVRFHLHCSCAIDNTPCIKSCSLSFVLYFSSMRLWV